MASFNPSIEKLQKKLDKDPNSLGFIQLVEEYRKEGDYEAALKTCQEGLKRHPNYWSARVALGRIHHEMRNSDLARQELEKVIQAVPDNLLANKLLGNIYSAAGRFQDALKRYKIVQMLTPSDQEVLSNIRRIEAESATVEPEPLPPVPPEEEPETDVYEEEEQIPEPDVAEIAMAQVPDRETGLTTPAIHPSESVQEAAPLQLEVETVAETGERIEPDLAESESLDWGALDESVVADKGLDLTEMAAMFLQSDSETAEKESAPKSIGEQDFMPSAEPLSFSTVQMEQEPAPDKPISFSTVQMNDMQSAQPEAPVVEPYSEVQEADELTTETLAELYVQQGLTDQAIKVYEKLLLNDPNNLQIAQKLKELGSLEASVSSGVSEASLEPEQTEPAVFVVQPGPGDKISEEIPARGAVDERRRKIMTLENWLAIIRRERYH